MSFRIQSTAKPKSKRLSAIVVARLSICQALQQAGETELVHHFRKLAGSVRADQLDTLGVRLDHRSRALEHAVGATDHDGEPACSVPACPPPPTREHRENHSHSTKA